MAIQMIDIGLDIDYDLEVINGDFAAVESTAQHQQQLIINNKGDYKQNPTICVGAVNYFDEEQVHALVRAISIEFTQDGMDVRSVRISPGGMITSDAFYV